VAGCLLRAIATRTAGSFLAALMAAYAVRKCRRTNSMPRGPKTCLAMLVTGGYSSALEDAFRLDWNNSNAFLRGLSQFLGLQLRQFVFRMATEAYQLL
jgi:hypothetical protein